MQVNLLIPAFGSLAGGRDWLVFRSSELDYNIHTSPNKTDSPRQATGVESKWADVKAPRIYPFLAPLCCTWLTRVGHVSSSAHAAHLLGIRVRDVTVADPVPEAVCANVLPWTHSTHRAPGVAVCWPNWLAQTARSTTVSLSSAILNFVSTMLTHLVHFLQVASSLNRLGIRCVFNSLSTP